MVVMGKLGRRGGGGSVNGWVGDVATRCGSFVASKEMLILYSQNFRGDARSNETRTLNRQNSKNCGSAM